MDPSLRRRPSKLAIALAVVLSGGAIAPAEAARIRAELEAETPRPAAGSRITLALHMTPSAGWHGYWQNPGDAGAPTHVAWALPNGVEVGPLRYPVPGRLMTGQLMNYVYERPYALLMTMQVPDELAAGTPLKIAGKARWLACSATLCVPEQGSVAIDLVVGDGKVMPEIRARFDQWRAKLPIALGKVASFEMRGGRVILSIPFSGHRQPSEAYFYPATDRVIDYAAPQLMRRRGDRLIVDMKLAARALPVTTFDGLFSTGRDRGVLLTARSR